jgi:exopolysaccharide production protein ExoY
VSNPSVAGQNAWPIAKSRARWGRYSFFGRAFAICFLILCAPLLLAVSLAVFILSRRTPLIAHRRVGQFGEEFWMVKIRTMWDRTPTPRRFQWIECLTETSVPVSKCASDPRVTSKFAALCRRYSLDELPQLIHAASGRMRLVGPRPITPAEWSTHYGDSASVVLSVAPGITGLWQIKGRNRLTYAQRRRLDLFYARHHSLLFDLSILLKTPMRVLTGRDAG